MKIAVMRKTHASLQKGRVCLQNASSSPPKSMGNLCNSYALYTSRQRGHALPVFAAFRNEKPPALAPASRFRALPVPLPKRAACAELERSTVMV